MKFIILLVIIGVALAEPQGYRSFQRQQDAPYAPSGYRPSGAQFRLPSERQQDDPRTIYGPPQEPEEPTTTTAPTTEEPTTLEPESPDSSNLNENRAKTDLEQPGQEEDVEQVNTDNNEQADQPPQQQGVYYILLPTGQLQQVQYYTTSDDQQTMAYTTQLKYQNVEPIRGPIYAYDPNSQFLQIVA